MFNLGLGMSDSDVLSRVCVICKERIEDHDSSVRIREKGAEGINAASIQRGDSIVVTADCEVHVDSRKQYTNHRMISHALNKTIVEVPRKRSARLLDGPFNNSTDCIYCGTTVKFDASDFSYVKTDTFVKTILQYCNDRCDEWGLVVRSRIEYYGFDLHAADCVYHHSCDGNFRSSRDIPLRFSKQAKQQGEKRRKPGRPEDDDKQQAFLKMCSYLEANDEEQITVADLANKMKEYLCENDALGYGNYYLKQKLQEHYENSVCFAQKDGLNNVVTMREKTSYILRSHFEADEDIDEEARKMKIIKTAARLLKSDIKTVVPSGTEKYPDTDMLQLDNALEYLPSSLRVFLDDLFVGTDKKQKIVEIGQSIFQAVRPRAVLAPAQIGLALQTHHLYRSRFIIDNLHKMGFAASYAEVLKFEKNAADTAAVDIFGTSNASSDVAMLFAGDNVDHNIISLDGKGTFHGMGMIAAVTPKQNTMRIIPRRSILELNHVEKSKIEIVEYRFANYNCRKVLFKPLPSFIKRDQEAADILWELSSCFKQKTPSWSGLMHLIHRNHTHPGRSSIYYLPMIDLPPGNKSCILSTLEFIYKEAVKHSVIPIITFDQPLYWKASEIIANAPDNSHLKEIVLLLGCFHTLMNLLGAVGYLMNGTGLKDILQVIYGENAVQHVLTGKAVQRAIRGHLLVDKCLGQMIVSDLANGMPEFAMLLAESEEQFSLLLKEQISLESVITSHIFGQINQVLNKH